MVYNKVARLSRDKKIHITESILQHQSHHTIGRAPAGLIFKIPAAQDLGGLDAELSLAAGKGRQQIAADNIEHLFECILLRLRRYLSVIIHSQHVDGQLRHGCG